MTGITGTRGYALLTGALAFDLYLELRVIVFYQLTHSYAFAASLIALTLLTSALADVPTGVFSDLVGRKRTITLGALAVSAAYTLYALHASHALLALGAVSEGVGLALFSGTTTAYLHDLLAVANQQDAYHHHYGRMMSLKTLASVLGILLGGLLATLSVSLLLWLNLLPKLLGLATALLLPEVPQQDRGRLQVHRHLLEAVRALRSNRTLRYASLGTMLAGGGFAAGELQAAAFAVVWPTWAVGIAKAVQSVAGIPGYWYAGRLIDWLGEAKLLLASMVTSVAGNLLTGAIRSVVSPLFVMLSLPLYGSADTAQQRVFQREFPDRQRATIASVNSFGNSISAALALALCGRIASRYGPFTALLATQALLVPALYFQLRFIGRLRRAGRD